MFLNIRPFYLCRLSKKGFAVSIVFGYFAKNGHALAKVFAVFDGAVDIFGQLNQKQCAFFDGVYDFANDNTAERVSLNIQVNRHLLRDDFYVELGVGIASLFPKFFTYVNYLDLPEISSLEDDMGVNSAAPGKVECPGTFFIVIVGNCKGYAVIFDGLDLSIIGKILASYDEAVRMVRFHFIFRLMGPNEIPDCCNNKKSITIQNNHEMM